LFDNCVLAITQYDGLTSLHRMDFSKVAFWIQMHHLPLPCMNREVGLLIGNMVGSVEDIDVVVDGVGWGKYLRVKVEVDVGRPLARGRTIHL
jgi:hypothetical protein